MEELDIETKVEQEVDDSNKGKYKLIVLNDEVNTFEHVIISLMQICELNQDRAVECTLMIHNDGQCEVLSGEEDDMCAMRDGLNALGIDAIVEKK